MTNTHKLSMAHSSKIFALLQQTAPQRMTEKDSPKAVIVAANLLNNSATRCVFIDMTVPTGATSIWAGSAIQTLSEQGNWTWINPTDICFNTELIIDMVGKQCVIDIPYRANRVYTWHLFACLHSDFIVHLEENL